MGLELTAVLEDLDRDGGALGAGLAVAAVALVVTLVVRALYVAPLVAWLAASARRGAELQPTLQEMSAHLDAGEPVAIRGREVSLTTPRRVRQFRDRLRYKIADIEYYRAAPLGAREGTVIVWAGMRGAVTVAAAQTLPETTPDRSLLVFVAFVVAAGSLLLQGGTLAPLVRWVRPAPAEVPTAAERAALQDRLTEADLAVLDRHPDDPDVARFRERLATLDADAAAMTRSRVRIRLEMIEAQRAALLDAREEGRFSSAALTDALENLDAEQISLELRSRGS
jgi:hypothetical protein